jgi:hypothetical protein
MVRTVGLFLFACAAALAQCSYRISPTSFTIGAGGIFDTFTDTIQVTAPTGCAWTAVSNADWILVVFGQRGTGNGQVGWSVGHNPTGSARTGTITIAGQTATITQTGATCNYTLVPASGDPIPVTGGSGSFTVKTSCQWTAAPSQPWIRVAVNTSTQTVNYTVDANLCTGDRTGTITVGDQVFPIFQPGAASNLRLTPASATVGSGASDGTFAVTTGAGCGWSAVPNATWVQITSGGAGSGGGTVGYHVGANTGAQRTAVITVGPQTFQITQAAADCTYQLNPATGSAPAGGGSGSFAVSTAAFCTWTATSNAAWLQLAGSGTRTGPGDVPYTVAANTSSAARGASVAVANQVFTLTPA